MINKKRDNRFFYFSLILIAMSVYMVFSHGLKNAVAFSVIDDGMYYPKIAVNFWQSYKITYDSVTITNGFHPLWLLINLPIYFILKNPLTALWGTYFLIFILLEFSLWFFCRISRELNVSVAGSIVAAIIIFFNLRSFTIFYSLLEAPLVLFVYLIYIFYMIKDKNKRFSSPKSSFISGLLIGIGFLARTDTVFLALSFMTIFIYKSIKYKIGMKTFFSTGLSACFGFIIPALPYMIANKIFMRSFGQVSAAHKINMFSFSSIKIAIQDFYDYLLPRLVYLLGLKTGSFFLIQIIVVFIICAILYVIIYFKLYKKISPLLSGLQEFVLFAAIHFTFVFLFTPDQFFKSSWYYVSELLLLGILIGIIIPETKKLKIAAASIFILIISLQVLYYPYYLRKKTMTFAKIEVADFIKNNIPGNAVLAMYDSGIVSYFSQRNFISLNGLIGDFGISELCNKQEYEKLAQKYHVNYLVIDIIPGSNKLYKGNELFVGKIKTKFMNFSEPQKVFAVFQVTPDQLQTNISLRNK